MARVFGFAQLELAGRLGVADGRYVIRDDGRERVLVIETTGAPPPSRRRRRKPREASGDEPPQELPLVRVTLVRAYAEFEDEAAAKAWLEETSLDEGSVDQVLAEALHDLNAALHAQAVAEGNPHLQTVSAVGAVTVRIGYGNGDELADGLFTAAHAVDPGRGAAGRRRRDEELRPQQRLAAVLGGRERLDACETLLLRARADLDAGREREAALQLRVGLEALFVELRGAIADPGHEEDMTALDARRHEAGELANAALQGELDESRLEALAELLGTSERVLRRRRVLGPRD